jgi:hypothetical protein
MNYKNEFTASELAHFKTLRVCILTPVLHVEPRWIASTVDMVAYSWERGLRIYKFGMTERLAPDWARNALAREAMGHQHHGKYFTHFLWLDSDQVFHPDLCCQLARHDVDFVSAVYYHRNGAPFPVAYVKTDDCGPDGYLHHPLMEIPTALVEVDAVGFGAVLMKRDVFLKVPEPWFTIDYRAGEDIAFCKKIKDYGFKVHLDGAYSIGHIGVPPIIDGQYYRDWVKNNPEKYSQKIQVQLKGVAHGNQSDVV